jgi:hypothetical protein
MSGRASRPDEPWAASRRMPVKDAPAWGAACGRSSFTGVSGVLLAERWDCRPDQIRALCRRGKPVSSTAGRGLYRILPWRLRNTSSAGETLQRFLLRSLD